VDAARKLAELAAFHFTATAMVLTGMVPDSLLGWPTDRTIADELFAVRRPRRTGAAS